MSFLLKRATTVTARAAPRLRVAAVPVARTLATAASTPSAAPKKKKALLSGAPGEPQFWMVDGVRHTPQGDVRIKDGVEYSDSPLLTAPLTHKAVVRTLYRRMLRTCVPHYFVGYKFFRFAQWLRLRFEEHRNETSPERIQKLIEGGYKWVKELQHPFPYVNIYAPGGSSWQRNTPLPLEALDQWGDPYAPEQQWNPPAADHGHDHGHGHGAHH